MNQKVIISAFATIISTLVFILPSNLYFLTMVQTFAAHAMIAYLALALLHSSRRKWIIASSFFVSFLVVFLYLRPYLNNDHEIDGFAELSVAHFNVLRTNKDYKSTVNSAIESGADIISFQEVDCNWSKALIKGLSSKYPFHKIQENKKFEGLAIFSKYPLNNTSIIYYEGLPNIVADVKFSETTIHIICSHTKSPVGKRRFKKRNRHISYIADYLIEKKGHVLAIGDYNAVPWDSSIMKFKEQSGLKDSRKNLAPTFPSYLGLPQIPIDYIFHSNELICLDFKTINGTSSDHLGVVGNYKFK